MNQHAAALLFERFNENHDPDNGQFASGSGSSGGSAAPSPQGTAAKAKEPVGYEFVSPSVADHMDFDEAVAAVSSDQQRTLREASVYINGALGVHAQEHDIVGAWSDGAENSIMDVVEKADWDKLILSGSMKGYIADQKSVLVFQQSVSGTQALASFSATGSLAEIHKNLLDDGVAFHSLVPRDGGATVYVAMVDPDTVKESIEAVKKGAARYDSAVEIQFGHGEFLGVQSDGSDREQRDNSRASYERNIAESKVVGSGELWQRVRDRWGQTRRQRVIHTDSALSALFRYNENHDPDTGEFASGGGSGGGTAPSAPALNPKAIDVGGDQWNRETATRLETEYQRAKPEIEQIVTDSVGEDAELPSEDEEDEDSPFVPDSWDAMSGDQQEDAKQHYITNSKDDVYNSEVENWQEQGESLHVAKDQLADKFYGSDTKSSWADDALEKLREDYGERIPFTDKQILDAITITYKDDDYDGKADPEIDFDDNKLTEPDSSFNPVFTKDQLALPGVDAPQAKEPHDALTDTMRSDIAAALTDAFNDQAENDQSDVEPPDYLMDSALEYLEETWKEKDDSEKFDYTESNTDIIKNAENDAESYKKDSKDSGPVELPQTFDPLQQVGGKDYQRTQRLANFVSLERQKQLVEARGIKAVWASSDPSRPKPDGMPISDSDIKRIDNELWSGWKGSSTNFAGSILQLATSKELGGRFRDLSTHTTDLIKQADDKYKAIGGFEGIKALVRAKWETTQFLLDKADVHTVEVYRGIKIPLDTRTHWEVSNNGQTMKAYSAADLQAFKDHAVAAGITLDVKEVPATPIEKVTFTAVDGQPRTFDRITDVHIVRNGAMSTTTSPDVANGWGGGAGDKVVLRIDAPRTSVLSVPAYGINVHAEKEVVIAGTAWKAWDAWRDKAPTFEDIPMGTKAAA